MRSLAVSLALCWLIAMPAAAQEYGSAGAGRNLAQEVCAACHAVGSDGLSDRALPQAPAFVSVANRPDMNAVSLSAFLITPHPTMPNLMLSQQEAADIIAYILSLRQRR